MLIKIFESMREEITANQKKLCTGELHGFWSSQNIIWVIKWRRMRWVEECGTY